MDPFHVLGGCFEDIQECIPEGIYLKMYDTLKTIKDNNSHADLLEENRRLTSVNNRATRKRVGLLQAIRDRDVDIQATVDMLSDTRELLEKSEVENDELKKTIKRLQCFKDDNIVDDVTDETHTAKKRKFEEIDLTEE